MNEDTPERLSPVSEPGGAGRRAFAYWRSWLALLLFAGGLAGGITVPGVLYLLPLAVYALLLSAFARTLLPGRMPLVSRLAAQSRGTLTPRLARYTRQVTLAWAILFALLLVATAMVAALAPAWIGFYGVSGLNTLVMILFFLAEYGVRRWYLADLEHLSFAAYLRFLAQVDWRKCL